MQKKYSKEFKREAVRLMVVDGQSGVEVSKKLGVNDSVIYRWKKEQLNEMEGVAEEYGRASPKEMSEEIHRLRKQLAKSERINEILKKNSRLFFQGRIMKYQFVAEQSKDFDVSEICEALELHRGSFYGWRNRGLSASKEFELELKAEITEIE